MTPVPKRRSEWLFPIEPRHPQLVETGAMQQHDQPELERVPGLFRRWELAQVLEPGCDYRLEDAGETDGGARLIAIYRGSAEARRAVAETVFEARE